MAFDEMNILHCWECRTQLKTGSSTKISNIIVTWSRGMSQMLRILILSYRLKEVINSYALCCFWLERIVRISVTRCLIEMWFRSKCSILYGQVIYIKNSKLNIADMWLISLDRVIICHTNNFIQINSLVRNGIHAIDIKGYGSSMTENQLATYNFEQWCSGEMDMHKQKKAVFCSVLCNAKVKHVGPIFIS